MVFAHLAISLRVFMASVVGFMAAIVSMPDAGTGTGEGAIATGPDPQLQSREVFPSTRSYDMIR